MLSASVPFRFPSRLAPLATTIVWKLNTTHVLGTQTSTHLILWTHRFSSEAASLGVSAPDALYLPSPGRLLDHQSAWGFHHSPKSSAELISNLQ